MDFVNETRVAAAWTMGFERDGRELMVVVIKATFGFPKDGAEPQLAEEQTELTEADEFTGEPGLSAPLFETDYAHRKPCCDVLVNGSAYVPAGKRPARQIGVGISVGTLVKSFLVKGNRKWKNGLVATSATTPEPFEKIPISYDNAFGGVDDSRGSTKIKSFLPNPIGRGYSHFKDRLDGKPLPNTEEFGKPVEDPSGPYRPMALGPVGRNWQPRASLAGTYDGKWLDSRAPFWPDDFDYRYFQSAPADQQIPYPAGGETVVLKNLTPDGDVRFTLPRLSMPVLVIPHQGADHQVDAVIDTILIEPDLARFSLTWRVSLPMRRNCFDIKQVIAGEMPKSWHRARRNGHKTHYKSLADLPRRSE